MSSGRSRSGGTRGRRRQAVVEVLAERAPPRPRPRGRGWSRRRRARRPRRGGLAADPLEPSAPRARAGAWAGASSGSSPISSRKRVPPSATSKRPGLPRSAPVNAPFSWPNSSDSMSVGGSAAQLTRRTARRARRLASWRRAARSSLPVPVSPSMRTVDIAPWRRTRAAWPRACRRTGLRPENRLEGGVPALHGSRSGRPESAGEPRRASRSSERRSRPRSPGSAK